MQLLNLVRIYKSNQVSSKIQYPNHHHEQKKHKSHFLFYPYTREGPAAAEAAPPKNDSNPTPAVSCSSRNKSSGSLNAPCTETIEPPTKSAYTRTDPTLVRNTTMTVDTRRIPSVSRSENVRPRIARGWSEGRKRYRKIHAARRAARKRREIGWEKRETARTREMTVK